MFRLIIFIVGSNRVRTVTPASIISTIAGTGVATYSGEGLPATSSGINYPTGVAIDTANGDMYVYARTGKRIQVVTGSSSQVYTHAGTGVGGSSGDGGAATSATFNSDGLWLDSTGRLYVADYTNNKIRVVYSVAPTSSPTVTPTVAPSGPSQAPTLSPTAKPTYSMRPSFSPSFARSTQNNVNVFAGTGLSNSTGTGGAATSASFNQVRSLWQDTEGSVYIVEYESKCIRKVSTSSGLVSKVAGICGTSGFGGDNGPATSALFNGTLDIQLDTASNLYISDSKNHRVRLVLNSGTVSTYAGIGTAGSSGDNGDATSAALNQPYGIGLSSGGSLYVVMHGSHSIRMITSSGTITAFAGKHN